MSAPATYHDWFSEALKLYPRIAVTGAPRAGKTTLCERVGDRAVIHTDDYMHLEWSEASEHIAELVNNTPGPLVVEGVRVPHALRKGMLVDCVIWLEAMKRYEHDVAKHKRREGMGNAAWTVLSEWRQSHPNVTVIIQGGLSLKNALPVREWP
jgi:hypothetical protein